MIKLALVMFGVVVLCSCSQIPGLITVLDDAILLEKEVMQKEIDIKITKDN